MSDPDTDTAERPRHTLKYDRFTDAGRAIGALYDGVQAAAVEHNGAWDTGDVAELLGQWFDSLGFDLTLPYATPPAELDRAGQPIGDVLLIPEASTYLGEDVDDVEYRERLACRYCGATHLKFMELSEVRYALRGVEDDVGGPVLVVDADPDHDPEGTSERLFCVSEGHELDQPDWLHRIWT